MYNYNSFLCDVISECLYLDDNKYPDWVKHKKKISNHQYPKSSSFCLNLCVVGC